MALRISKSALFICLAVTTAAAQTQPLDKRIDDYLTPFVQGKNFIGAVLVAKGNQVLFHRAYGQANYALGVPNTAKTRFHVASISKLFTAAAILLLEERGRLSVEDPVAKYVPDFPSGDKITLRQLLTH